MFPDISSRRVDLGGRSAKNKNVSKKDFLEKNRREREQRQERQRQATAAERIQKTFRARYYLSRAREERRRLYDSRIADVEKVVILLNAKNVPGVGKVLANALESLLPSFLFFFAPRAAPTDLTLRLPKLLELFLLMVDKTRVEGTASALWLLCEGGRAPAPPRPAGGTPTSSTTSTGAVVGAGAQAQAAPASSGGATAQAQDASNLSVSANRWRRLFALFCRHLHGLQNVGTPRRHATPVLDHAKEVLAALTAVSSKGFIRSLAVCPAVFHFLRDVSMVDSKLRSEAQKLFAVFQPLQFGVDQLFSGSCGGSLGGSGSTVDSAVGTTRNTIISNVDNNMEVDSGGPSYSQEQISPAFLNFNADFLVRADFYLSAVLECLFSLLMGQTTLSEAAFCHDVFLGKLCPVLQRVLPRTSENIGAVFDEEILINYLVFYLTSAFRSARVRSKSGRQFAREIMERLSVDQRRGSAVEAWTTPTGGATGAAAGPLAGGGGATPTASNSLGSSKDIRAFSSKYGNPNTSPDVRFRRSREHLTASLSELSKEDIKPGHPRLAVLYGYGNVLAALDSAVRSSTGPLRTSSSTVDSAVRASSATQSPPTKLLFFLLSLFPPDDAATLEPYLESGVRKQLQIKESASLVRGLSEKCELADVIACYFGPHGCDVPPDPVVSQLAFSTNFVTKLGLKVLELSAKQWVDVVRSEELLRQEVHGGGMGVGSQSLGTSTVFGGAVSSTVAGGSSSSTAAGGTGGLSLGSFRPEHQKSLLFLIPLCCVFHVQSSVLHDAEFFSNSNPLADKLEQLTNLLNRFAFLVLQEIEALAGTGAASSSGARAAGAAASSSSAPAGRVPSRAHGRIRPPPQQMPDDDVASMLVDEVGSSSSGQQLGGGGDDAMDVDGEDAMDDLDETEKKNFGFAEFRQQNVSSPFLRLVKDKVCILVRGLYDRSRRFTTEEESKSDRSLLRSFNPQFELSFPGQRKSNLVLVEVPHCIPFSDRVSYLQQWIINDQDSRENRSADMFFFAGGHRRRVRRSMIVEDGLAAFEDLNETDDLRESLRIQFVTDDGEPEAGIDGGGLFKEFLLQLTRAMFSPGFGLFAETSDGKLVPRPLSESATIFGSVEMALKMYFFLGKVVGKAVFENCLLEPQFSRVFLNLLLNRENTVDDLWALDRDLAKNILYCKTNDVTDLGLTFAVTLANFGVNQSVDLIPNGRNIDVTEDNKIRYIHLLAFRRTTSELRRQAEAFKQGMLRVLSKHWLEMFDPYELNSLISGTPDLRFEELKACCTYGGGYQADSPAIVWLWDILLGYPQERKAKFLQFVTSCSRAPLLGYKSFYPPFCIHRVPDNDRLPTASTCANLLKLPDYMSAARLKEKLDLALQEVEGFHLS